MGLWETFVTSFPKIIAAAAASQLGVLSLIVLCLSLVIIMLFKDKSGPITLFAFAGLLVSLSFFGWLLLSATKIFRDDTVIIGPLHQQLAGATIWTGKNILVRSGTTVETNGFPFEIEATDGWIELEGLSIRSFNDNEVPEQRPAKEVASIGSPIDEAGQCSDGQTGNRGSDGTTGADGRNGKDAALVELIAKGSIIGKVTIRNVGMNGGDGGSGGQGGQGGRGQQGGPGRMNYLFGQPTDCACGGGWGGAPGRGGDGGDGGLGGLPGGRRARRRYSRSSF